MVRATTQQGQAGAGLGPAPLFDLAFKQSRNAMVLVDGNRCHVDANGAYLRLLGYTRQQLIGRPIYSYIVGGPKASPAEWDAALADGRFTGETTLRDVRGNSVAVQYAGSSEIVTGRYLVLFVVLSTARWGRHFRRQSQPAIRYAPLSRRECEIVSHIAMGETGQEIAEELHIAHDTVRSHVRNAMNKMDARSRAHLVAKALGEGVVLSEMLATNLPSSASMQRSEGPWPTTRNEEVRLSGAQATAVGANDPSA
jgi:PAS domain S-box-containing protein